MKDILSIKYAWLILHSVLKACVTPPLEENYKGCKINTHMYPLALYHITVSMVIILVCFLALS